MEIKGLIEVNNIMRGIDRVDSHLFSPAGGNVRS